MTDAAAKADTPAGKADLATALNALITEAGNNSNLILDPDLDSFYVMDALVVQLPNALVTAAQAEVPTQADTANARVAEHALLAGSLSSRAGALSGDADTAVANTERAQLETELGALAAASEAADTLHTRSPMALTTRSPSTPPSSAPPRARPSPRPSRPSTRSWPPGLPTCPAPND